MIRTIKIIAQNFKCVNIEINEEKVRKSLKTRENDIFLNFQKVFKKGDEILKIKNKGELLLEFRRYIEMLLRVGTILCVENKYDGKISAINQENIIFYLDERYYTDFQVCSFMDIFKIETKDYKRIYWGESNILPHLGAILDYVEKHYNSTYRFFTNRNLEYHYIYTVLYNKNYEIRELINILNSYHYETSEKNMELYNMKLKEIVGKVKNIVLEIKKIEKKLTEDIDKQKDM